MNAIRIRRPEGGEEHGVVFTRRHACKNAAEFRAAFEDPYVDELQFAVGLHGWEVPVDIPFDVTATEPCAVCGALVKAWFEWYAPKVHAGPDLWTP